MKKVLMSSFVLFVVASAGYGDTVYKWVDKDNAVSFTDDYDQIPSEYRHQVQQEELGESQNVETPAPSPAPTPENDGARVDIYGKGENYWKARVQLYKKQLEEATENIQSIIRKINERVGEEAGKKSSRTQQNMDLAYRNHLLEEMSKYQAQVRKANEMLSKIRKEAEEAEANLEWLK